MKRIEPNIGPVFKDRETEVKELVKGLKDRDTSGELQSVLTQFSKSHTSLGESYRKGYETFITSRFNSGLADDSVRGIDREPSKLIYSIGDISSTANGAN